MAQDAILHVLLTVYAKPVAPGARGRLRGARRHGPPQEIPDGPIRVQRRVSCRGVLQVCRQRVHVGPPHAGTTVTVEVDDTYCRILDQHDTMPTVVPRTNLRGVRLSHLQGQRCRPGSGDRPSLRDRIKGRSSVQHQRGN